MNHRWWTLLAAMPLVLSACGGSGPAGAGGVEAPAPASDVPRKKPAPQVAGPETQPLPVTPSPADAQPANGTIVEQVSVSVADAGPGIAANIQRLDPLGHPTAIFTKTDANGRAAPHKGCAPDEQFQVDPVAGSYLERDPLPCASTLAFEVYSAAATMELLKRGDEAFQQGRFTEAQGIYGAAAERLRVSRPAQFQQVTQKYHAALGQALGSVEVATPDATGQRLGPDAVQRLKSFQRESHLPETGEPDARTSEALRHLSIEEAQRRARKFASPPSASALSPAAAAHSGQVQLEHPGAANAKQLAAQKAAEVSR